MAEPYPGGVWEALQQAVVLAATKPIPTEADGPVLRCTCLFACKVPRSSNEIPIWCPECRGDFN
ncbi:MAG: hypothetical protein M3N53_00060 [Actinomycetota bacterium]|nr:hypothetical protein [Actinomycetota bacterium]